MELYDNDEFEVFIVVGKNGFGKTTYANKIIAEVYSNDGLHKNWNTDLFKDHMGYHPDRVLTKWEKKRKRDYVFHWDDAGVWLNALDHTDPFVKSVGKYLQTARDDWGCIIFSCIDKNDIVSKIRNFKSTIIIDITKHGAEPNSPYPSKRNNRKATAWHYWEDRFNKKGTENDWEESFNCHVPDEFYTWYKPLRSQYTRLAKRNMIQKLRKKRGIMALKSSM